jgi:methanethiol S-methyltransferase
LKRALFLIYGLICYATFFGSFLYAIGFVGNFVVPKSMDSGPAGPIGLALAIDALLLGLFALQHSGMARQGFKRWWTRIVPAPIERSTYVLVASLALDLLFWQWRPIGGAIWDLSGTAFAGVLVAVSVLGWLIVLVSTFVTDHFDLFGLRQVLLYAQGQAYTKQPLSMRGFYHRIRHPIYLGFTVAFWATPVMTIGHLVFALATTAYMLIAIQLEERDLLTIYGDAYRAYKERVAMLIPLPGHRA